MKGGGRGERGKEGVGRGKGGESAEGILLPPRSHVRRIKVPGGGNRAWVVSLRLVHSRGILVTHVQLKGGGKMEKEGVDKKKRPTSDPSPPLPLFPRHTQKQKSSPYCGCGSEGKKRGGRGGSVQLTKSFILFHIEGHRHRHKHTPGHKRERRGHKREKQGRRPDYCEGGGGGWFKGEGKGGNESWKVKDGRGRGVVGGHTHTLTFFFRQRSMEAVACESKKGEVGKVW